MVEPNQRFEHRRVLILPRLDDVRADHDVHRHKISGSVLAHLVKSHVASAHRGSNTLHGSQDDKDVLRLRRRRGLKRAGGSSSTITHTIGVKCVELVSEDGLSSQFDLAPT